MSKSFLFLLVLVIILGASLGGAFVGGVVLGRNQPEDAGGGVPVEQVSQEAAPAGTPAGAAATGNSAPGGSPASLGDSPGNSSGDAGSAGPSGRGGLNGTAQRLEGNVLTVVTPPGRTAGDVGR